MKFPAPRPTPEQILNAQVVQVGTPHEVPPAAAAFRTLNANQVALGVVYMPRSKRYYTWLSTEGNDVIVLGVYASLTTAKQLVVQIQTQWAACTSETDVDAVVALMQSGVPTSVIPPDDPEWLLPDGVVRGILATIAKEQQRAN